MKVINVNDLIIVLSRLDESVTDLDLDDFDSILELFGDDHYASGNVMEKVQTSHDMDKLRKHGIKRGFIARVRGLRKSSKEEE